jgi:hypothetical protein
LRPNGQCHLAVGGSDQHERVAEEIRARRWLDQVALRHIVHPVEIRRYENIGRRAIFDLAGERRARPIGDHDLPVGLAQIQRFGLVERILEACGAKHQDVLALSERRTGDASHHKHRSDQAKEHAAESQSTKTRHHQSSTCQRRTLYSYEYYVM